MPEDAEVLERRPSRIRNFIEDWLIVPKLLYFSLNMAVYSTYYFTSNYFETVWNIPIHSYGFISGLSTAGFLGSIFWTMVADRTGAHKPILMLTAIGFASTFGLLRFEPWKDRGWEKILFVSIIYGLANFFVSALYPLLDNRIFAILIKNPNFTTKLYGKQRLWGSIGQAVISLINAHGIASPLGFDIMFINMAWTTTIFLIFVWFGIPKIIDDRKIRIRKEPVEVEDNVVESRKEKLELVPMDSTIFSSSESAKTAKSDSSLFRPVRTLLSNPHFIFFIILILAAGYVRSILGHFLVYYFDRTMKQSPKIYALAMQTRLISEIMFFFLGKSLLDRIGAFWMMMLGLSTGTIRVAAYAIIPATKNWSYAAFPLEFLKGVNNACIITAGVRIAHALAPRGCEATAQGFFSGIQSSLANALAGIMGGLILKHYSLDRLAVQKLFMHTSIFSTLTCVAYGAQQFFWPATIE